MLTLTLVSVAMVDDAAKANEWLSAPALFIMQAQYAFGHLASELVGLLFWSQQCCCFTAVSCLQ